MPRISVASVKKPTTPLTTFKFLRRDEGRLSYSQNTPETPSSKGAETSRVDRERRDSKSLREAIAYDMRNARSHDPLGEVVVAVPKKAVPPGRGGDPSGDRPPDPPLRRAPPRGGTASRRPAWVDPEIPTRRAESLDPPPSEERVPLGPSDVVETPPRKETLGERVPYLGSEDDPRYGVRRGRDGLLGPRAGPGGRRMASVPPHHLDPSYVDYDHNYFRGSPPQLREYSLSLINRSHEEESLVFQLEQEIRAVQEERARYTYAKSQLDRERQRFETYKLDAQQQLDDERANLAALRAQDQREARKEVNSIDERYKSVTTLLSMERETNKRLHQENESLHAQLEELTSAMRESQAAHRAEVLRMRRDIDSLTRRNSELLAMAKEEQINNLVMPTPKTRPTTVVSKPTPPLTRNDNSENAPTTVPAEPPAKVVDTSIPIDNEDNGSTHSSGVPAKLVQHVVFDFTPQSSNTAARQRRAKAVEERLQRVEEERQRAREEAEEARMKQEKQAKEQINLLIKKQSERSERRPSQANSKPPEDALKERKAAEHPLRTPRVIGSAKNTTSAKPVVVPLKLKPHIPTKKELLQEVEPRPEEDYPDDEIITSTTQADSPNKREIAYRSGKKEIHYANGTVKVVLPSQHVILHFTNGDIKCTFPSGKSTYWYDTAQTSHTQLPSGVQLFEFCATGQSERHMPDGTKEILYPDGVYKIVHVDGSAETHLPDES